MWAWIGLFFTSLFGMSLVPIILRVLTTIGLTAVSMGGIYALTSQLQTQMMTQFNGLPADVAFLMGLMHLDVALSMIISAATAKWAFNGWNALTDKRSGRVWQAPGTGGTQPF